MAAYSLDQYREGECSWWALSASNQQGIMDEAIERIDALEQVIVPGPVPATETSRVPTITLNLDGGDELIYILQRRPSPEVHWINGQTWDPEALDRVERAVLVARLRATADMVEGTA